MTKTGIGFDSHRSKSGRPLIIGGVAIPHSVGLDGHSDADVLCHAIIDAMLGSVAAGDIGFHFPDTDPRWEGVSSIELLRMAARLLAEKGGCILNIDSTVVAEAPKLSPYIDQMRDNIAAVLGVGKDAVSVKAKTSERMGAIGRGEGIAAMAVATVEIGG